MDVDGNGFTQHLERGSGGLGRLSRGRRTERSPAARKHCADRSKHCAPHPLPAGKTVTVAVTDTVNMTAAIHTVLPSKGRRAGRHVLADRLNSRGSSGSSHGHRPGANKPFLIDRSSPAFSMTGASPWHLRREDDREHAKR